MAWATSVVFPYPGPAITRVSFFCGIVSNTFFNPGLEMASDEQGTGICDIKGSTYHGLQKRLQRYTDSVKKSEDQAAKKAQRSEEEQRPNIEK